MTPHDRLGSLLARTSARAAGWWRVVGGRLEQAAFRAVDDMPGEVALAFARATLSVPIVSEGFGIVRAANTGVPAVSRAAELPEDSGSGLWLRRFGADRSVAVPFCDGSGVVTHVISLALAGASPGDQAVIDTIRGEAGPRIPNPGGPGLFLANCLFLGSVAVAAVS